MTQTPQLNYTRQNHSLESIPFLDRPLGRRKLVQAAILLSGPGFLRSPLLGQSQPGSRVDAQTKPVFFKPHELPLSLRSLLLAHGNRFQAPGKERLVVSGSIKRGATNSNLQVINELPGKVHINETGGRGKSLIFDLENLGGAANIDDTDEDLVESLALDTPEQFFLNLRFGGSWRMLGQGFQVKNDTGFGAQVDIYELTTVVLARKDKQVRTKHFMFDYRTGLLRRVAYTATKGNQIYRTATLYSEYSQIEGNAVPGKIQRIENGNESFAFSRQSAALTSLAATSTADSK